MGNMNNFLAKTKQKAELKSIIFIVSLILFCFIIICVKDVVINKLLYATRYQYFQIFRLIHKIHN